jgi:RNase H-fold protein (predicted Holliday junction resolvase)
LRFRFRPQAHRRGLRQPPAAHGPAAATIKAEGDARFALVSKRHLQRMAARCLVVGVPYHPDGASTKTPARAQVCAPVARALRLPVFEVDERYSTTEALAEWRQAMPMPRGLHHSWNSF